MSLLSVHTGPRVRAQRGVKLVLIHVRDVTALSARVCRQARASGPGEASFDP